MRNVDEGTWRVRILIGVATVVALVLLALWVTSYENRRGWTRDGLHAWQLRSCWGAVHLVWVQTPDGNPISLDKGSLATLPGNRRMVTITGHGWGAQPMYRVNSLGFAFHSSEFSPFRFPHPPGRLVIIVIPYWFFLSLWMAATSYVACRRIQPTRRWRMRRGLCLTCGYDLRAHSPGQKCPECGTEVPAGSGAAAGKAGAG